MSFKPKTASEELTRFYEREPLCWSECGQKFLSWRAFHEITRIHSPTHLPGVRTNTSCANTISTFSHYSSPAAWVARRSPNICVATCTK